MDDPGQSTTSPEHGHLNRGHTRSQLIRQIATHEHSYAELGRRYGVSRSAISQFAARWALAISDAQRDIDDETTHLWVSHRAARLAELQQTIEDIDSALSEIPDDRAQLLRIRLQAIRQAAEETGQLTQNDDQKTVRIEFNGVDVSQLT